jgi:hypothetical protein
VAGKKGQKFFLSKNQISTNVLPKTPRKYFKQLNKLIHGLKKQKTCPQT